MSCDSPASFIWVIDREVGGGVAYFPVTPRRISPHCRHSLAATTPRLREGECLAMRGGLVGFVRYKYKSGIHSGKTPNDEVNQNGRFPLGMDRRTAPIVLSGALFLAIATAGWLVLRTLRTGGLEITPNWRVIAAFGVPLV